MGVGDFAKEEFSKEELEALGEAEVKVDDKKKTDEGAGKSPEEIAAEAAAKAAAGGTVDDPSKTADEKKPVELSTEEKAIADQEGVKLITDDKGKQWLVDDEGAKIPVETMAQELRKDSRGCRYRQKDHRRNEQKIKPSQRVRS